MKTEHNINSMDELTVFITSYWREINHTAWCDIIKQFFNTNTLGKPQKLDTAVWLIERYDKHLNEGITPHMFDNGYVDFHVNRDWKLLPFWKFDTDEIDENINN